MHNGDWSRMLFEIILPLLPLQLCHVVLMLCLRYRYRQFGYDMLCLKHNEIRKLKRQDKCLRGLHQMSLVVQLLFLVVALIVLLRAVGS